VGGSLIIHVNVIKDIFGRIIYVRSIASKFRAQLDGEGQRGPASVVKGISGPITLVFQELTVYI
jgi:hypothetical protein